MNERIKLLAEQVTKESELYCAIPIDMNKESYQFFAQVFAELIVKECVSILMIPEHVMNHHQELTDYYRGWVNGRLLGIEHIKKHFGVEK